MVSSLHERIAAELDRREEMARAVPYLAAKMWDNRTQGVGALAARRHWTDEAAEAIEACARLHEPADALRRYAAARRVLDRHKAVEWDEGDVGCWHCSGQDAVEGIAFAWPCPEIRDLAASLGLEVDD